MIFKKTINTPWCCEKMQDKTESVYPKYNIDLFKLFKDNENLPSAQNSQNIHHGNEIYHSLLLNMNLHNMINIPSPDYYLPSLNSMTNALSDTNFVISAPELWITPDDIYRGTDQNFIIKEDFTNIWVPNQNTQDSNSSTKTNTTPKARKHKTKFSKVKKTAGNHTKSLKTDMTKISSGIVLEGDHGIENYRYGLCFQINCLTLPSLSIYAIALSKLPINFTLFNQNSYELSNVLTSDDLIEF